MFSCLLDILINPNITSSCDFCAQVEETSSGSNFREEASLERGLPQLEDSSIIPAKGNDVNTTSSAVSQVVQARTDVVIGGGGSKALGLRFSSKIDIATTSSPIAMVVTTKRSKLVEHQLWQFYLGLSLGGGVGEGEFDSAQVSEIISTEDLDSTSEEVESTSTSSNSGLHQIS